MRALTHVTDTSDIASVPTVQNGNKRAHTIGLGAMGLHTLFASNQINYGSPESLEFTDIFFMTMNYYTLKASNKIAKERGETFADFDKSKYATGEYFDMYIGLEEYPYVPTYMPVEDIFKNHHIPTEQDWKDLKREVMKYGLYHQNRLAVAPNGSISYVNETSASIHPIISVVEERQEKKVGKIYYPAPRLSNDTMPYYTSAYDIPPTDVINVYATAQKHVDQGMSLTLFTRSEVGEGIYPWKPLGGKTTTRDLTLLRHYAWRKGIKSIYYVRTLTEGDEEVGVSECESCTI